MQNNEKNFVSATVAGPRKREIGLVVPAKFSAYAADRRVADILSKEILKLKQSTLTLIFNMKKIKSFVKGLIYLKKKNRKNMRLFSFVLNKRPLSVT